MPRPRLCRRVRFEPNVTYFKPKGIGLKELDVSILTVDEFEAVRLKDFENMDQEKAAKKMDISQPTFHRLVLSARKKIADAIVNGKAIKIEGGNYKMVKPRGRGLGPGGGRGLGRGGRGRMGGPLAAGPEGVCKCPNCGTEVHHKVGVPCYQETCPKCGAKMVRGR
ncbi:MAG: DUF134 domain-containing protein [Nanoarchaeota archaeon]|nr:DUF134 domain-containing protein [Nanoarchaeota archaeon]